MLSKESKIRVLENFYGIDYILLGKPANKVSTCCPIVKEEYLAVKGALMSVHIEMLKLIEHAPEPLYETVDKRLMLSNARMAAQIARENAQKIVTSQKARRDIKESLRDALQENSGVDVSTLVEKQIRMKAFGLAIDNLLVARTLQESNCESLNTWEGKIIEDSYKILRDNLIESAYMIVHPQEESEDLNEFSQRTKDLAKAAGKGAAIGAAAGVGTGLVIRAAAAKLKCRKIQDPEKKKACFKDLWRRGVSARPNTESEDLTEWGSTPSQQMKEAQQEEKEERIEIKRKCMKYKAMGQPAKEKACIESEMAKHKAHWSKVFADIKRRM